MQKESLRTRRSGGCYSRYFAGGFALRRCRNSIRRYSAAPKREFRSQFPLFPLSNQTVHSHGLSSTWCIAVSPFTGIRRFSDTQIELKMNSTPISGERLPMLAVNTEHHFYHHSPPSSFHVQLNSRDNHYGFRTLINGHAPRKNVFSPPVRFSLPRCEQVSVELEELCFSIGMLSVIAANIRYIRMVDRPQFIVSTSQRRRELFVQGIVEGIIYFHMVNEWRVVLVLIIINK